MTGLNEHITKQIKKLKSSDANIRYEGCEFLRAAPSITAEAIKALEKAVDDPDILVSQTAKRALEIHSQQGNARDLIPPIDTTKQNRSTKARKNLLIPGSAIDSPEYIFSLEKRIMILEYEIEKLNEEKSKVSLPQTRLLSPSFMTRAFAVWGHLFVAQLIISAILWIIFIIINALFGGFS